MTVKRRRATSARRASLVAAGAALASLFGTMPAIAGDRPESVGPATFTLLMENDKFNGTDEWYTSGAKLIVSRPTRPPSLVFSPLVNANEWLLGERGKSSWELALGQNIYEPSNEKLDPPDPRDRPYAGWLYLSAAAVTETRKTQNILEVQLGVVGPSALGEFTQSLVHELISADDPKGWDHQLSDEPGLLVALERRWRTDPVRVYRGVGIDVVPHVSASLGNVQTNVGAGVMLRFGNALKADFGLPRVRPAGSAGVPVIGNDWGWYVFAGFDGWAVARDIFLDGNTFEDSPSVEKKPLVAEYNMGFSLYAPNVRFSATFVHRSKEFDGQPHPFEYGSAALTFNF